LAEDIREDYPDIFLHTFAYQYTKKAPVDMTVADHVIVRLCNIECSWDTPMEKQALERPDSQAAGFVQNLSDWGKLCKHLYIWDYACNFSFYMFPFPNYHVLKENLLYYKKNNVKGVLQQGNFAYGETSGLADLECYLAAKMLWDPNQNEEQIIDDFLRGVYGEACYPYMKEYVELLCAAVTGKPLKLKQDTDAEHFSEEALEKVWDVFYRTDSARNGKGTGLGLAIVKNLVQLHGGKCSVQNLDQGVEFSIIIPQRY
jgi:hypothetical protein